MAAVISTALMSCSDDDAEDSVDDLFEVASLVVYNDVSYDLDHGYFELLGENVGLDSYDVEVYLTASSVTLSASSGEFSGDGTFLYLDFNSQDENELSSGTYTFLEKGEERDPFTFAGGYILTNYDEEIEDKSEYEQITGGTIKVTTEESKVSFVIDLTSTNSTIKGNFSNSLSAI
ncbi:hypothetical protein [Reichenbachiella faecimaris]|nr:hypothetical protein [Reichenbachiella faecimaris]